jgi:hypothetical protein
MARSLQIPQYTAGTIAIGALSGGYYPVTGVGTSFLSPDNVTNWTIGIGDMLICGNAFGIVAAVNSPTSLSLVTWSGGIVAAGATYAINRLSGMASQAIAGLLQQLLATVTTAAITGGAINGATIGLTASAAGAFSSLVAPAFTGDAGSGGAAGLVPAPPAGSAAIGNALLANGAWGVSSAGWNGCGFVNKFRNGAMDVAQRGISGTVAAGTTAYTLDGWMVSASGASVVWAQTWDIVLSFGIGVNSLYLAAASGLSACSLIQRIESYLADDLLPAYAYSGAPAITVQFVIGNGTAATLTPTLSTGYPSARDNFGAVTADLGPVNLQSIPPYSLATVAYTFVPNAGILKGYQISLNFNGQLNASSGGVFVSYADVRATPGLPTGLNSSPPSPEHRPISLEMLASQRYYNFLSLPSVIFGGYQVGGGSIQANLPFPPMRVTPAVTTAPGTWTLSNVASTWAPGAVSNALLQITMPATVTGALALTSPSGGGFALSAEL